MTYLIYLKTLEQTSVGSNSVWLQSMSLKWLNTWRSVLFMDHLTHCMDYSNVSYVGYWTILLQLPSTSTTTKHNNIYFWFLCAGFVSIYCILHVFVFFLCFLVINKKKSIKKRRTLSLVHPSLTHNTTHKKTHKTVSLACGSVTAEGGNFLGNVWSKPKSGRGRRGHAFLWHQSSHSPCTHPTTTHHTFRHKSWHLSKGLWDCVYVCVYVCPILGFQALLKIVVVRQKTSNWTFLYRDGMRKISKEGAAI